MVVNGGCTPVTGPPQSCKVCHAKGLEIPSPGIQCCNVQDSKAVANVYPSVLGTERRARPLCPTLSRLTVPASSNRQSRQKAQCADPRRVPGRVAEQPQTATSVAWGPPSTANRQTTERYIPGAPLRLRHSHIILCHQTPRRSCRITNTNPQDERCVQSRFRNMLRGHSSCGPHSFGTPR